MQTQVIKSSSLPASISHPLSGFKEGGGLGFSSIFPRKEYYMKLVLTALTVANSSNRAFFSRLHSPFFCHMWCKPPLPPTPATWATAWEFWQLFPVWQTFLNPEGEWDPLRASAEQRLSVVQTMLSNVPSGKCQETSRRTDVFGCLLLWGQGREGAREWNHWQWRISAPQQALFSWMTLAGVPFADGRSIHAPP